MILLASGVLTMTMSSTSNISGIPSSLGDIWGGEHVFIKQIYSCIYSKLVCVCVCVCVCARARA